MTLRISRQQYAQLLDWAEQAGDVECCGLLLGYDGQLEAVELADNVAADPARHFEIDPADLIAAERAARAGAPAIIGYFHSHPNGLARPSTDDVEKAADDGRIWVIIANGDVSGWRKLPGQSEFEEVALVIDG